MPHTPPIAYIVAVFRLSTSTLPLWTVYGRDPPSSVALSDELVYWVTKYVGMKERRQPWPEDFNATGEVRPGRMNVDPAPLGISYGLGTTHSPIPEFSN
jgi:hypothetical protein